MKVIVGYSDENQYDTTIPLIVIITSIGLLTSFSLVVMSVQTPEAQAQEKCTTFESTDGLLTSERCTVQGQDPYMTHETCTAGACTGDQQYTTNKEVAQAKTGSLQSCNELTRENRDNPNPSYTCTTNKKLFFSQTLQI